LNNDVPRATEVTLAAARLRVTIDRKLGRRTKPVIVKLAQA